MAHLILDTDAVFGVYEPRTATPGLLLAPLLNGNHLAGHLTLGVPACIWMASRSTRIDARICCFGAVLLVFLCGVCTLSRGGVVALCLGGGSYSLWLLGRVRIVRWSPLTISAAVAAGVAVAVTAWLAVDAAGQRLWAERASVDKLEIIRSLAPLTLQSPWTGVGRGALGDLTIQYVEGTNRVVFAENLPVQWAAEWGFPLTLVLLAALAGVLVRRPKGRAEAALLCGVVALGAQNLVDFSLELMGIAVVAALAVGVLAAKGKWTRAIPRIPLRTALPIVLVLNAVAVAAAYHPSTGGSRKQLRRDLELKLDAPAGVFETTLREALTSYPLDPHLILLGTARAVRRGDPLAGTWVNLSLDVAGKWALSHIHAAYWLERQGRPDQAVIELSLAADIDPTAWHAPACAFLRRHPRADLAMGAAASTAKYRERTIEDLSRCMPSDDERERMSLLMLDEGVAVMAAQFARIDIANRRADPTAVALAEEAYASHPGNPTALAVLLDALARHGQARRAVVLFEHAPAAQRRHHSVLRAAASAAVQARDVERVAALAQELLSTHGSTPEARSQLESFVSELYRRMGNAVLALAHAQAAYDLTGTAELAALVHRAATEAGVPQVALRMASELCHLRYQPETYCPPQSAFGP